MGEPRFKASDLYTPSCRFCGISELPISLYESQEQADEAATLRCSCAEAKQYQYELEKKQKREINIMKLGERIDELSEYCAAREIAFGEDLHTAIIGAGTAVLDDVVEKAVIHFERMKVSISKNSVNVLVIGFTYSDGKKMEVI